MPVDPRELGRSSAISVPTPCTGCGYDLIGLSPGGCCPECGQPIESSNPLVIRSNNPWPCGGCGAALLGLKPGDPCPRCGRIIRSRLRKVFSGHNFLDSPRGYLVGVATAGALLLCGWGGMAAGLLVRGTMDESAGALFFAAGGAVWWIGTFMITRARPIAPTADVDPRTEWLIPRLIARVTQAFWVVAGGAALGGGGGAEALSTFAFIVACFGLIALFIVLSNLTYWATDSASSSAYRTMTWVLPLSTLVAPAAAKDGLASIAAMLPTWQAPMAGLRILVIGVFVVAPEVWLAYTLFDLYRLGTWAIKNRASAEVRDRHLRERAAASAQVGPLAGSGVDETDLPGYKLGDSAAGVSAQNQRFRPGGGAGLIRRKRKRPEAPPPTNAPFE